MESVLTERGHTLCAQDAPYDAFIVNTCAVTAESGRKSRQIIRKLKSQRPEAICAVCGCFSQISPEDMDSIGADLVSGSAGRLKFIDDLESIFAERQKIKTIDEPLKRRHFEVLPSGSMGTRTRATLKIQDGCSNFCAYCIIPYARGPVRSMTLEDMAFEAKKLSEEGYREIVITGIEISSYGRDLEGKPTLSNALETIASSAPGLRLRLGSLEPRVITEELCEKMVSIGTLCPHFHLSLQSGCDRTLNRMKRKYDTALFYEKTVLLRKYFPGCAITADLIAGFPGETDEDHEETLAFLKKCAFSDLHVFPYSLRPGTAAAEMDGHLVNAVKHKRAAEAAKTGEKSRKAYLESQIGKTLSVLFETEKDGYSYGHSGNYLMVSVCGTELKNQVRDVYITGTDGEVLLGSFEGM